MTDPNEPRCLLSRHFGLEPYFQLTKADYRWYSWLKKPKRVMADRRQPAHTDPRGWGAINRVYPNAIEVGHTQGRSQGMAVFSVLILAAATTIAFIAGITFFPLVKIFSIISFLMMLLAAFCTWWVFRIGFWSANDQPFLFLKKEQQVVVLHVEKPHFFKVWTGGKTHLAVYPWETVQARTYRVAGGGAANVVIRRFMALLFSETHESRKLKAFAEIGILDNFTDDTLVQIWEYIRRYMEEDSAPVGPGCIPNPHAPPCLLPAQYIDAAGGAPLDVDTIDAMLQEQGTSLSPELRKALERSETATSTAAIA